VKHVKHAVMSICVVTLGLCAWGNAQAQTEVTLLAPMPMGAPFKALIAGFEAKTGDKVTATYIPTLQMKTKVAAGQGADVNIMVPPYDEALSSGNLDAKSATTLASFVVAIVVAKGATPPDVSTPAAVKTTLLSAKSFVSIDPATGSAGVAAQAVLEKLGIADQVKDKVKLVAVGAALKAVTAGDGTFSLGPYVSDVRANEMVDGFGLPMGAYTPTNIVGYVSSKASDAKAAKALLDYLTSAEAEAEYKSIGMLPAH
jgi:molybdate transport system substrate-binding protein